MAENSEVENFKDESAYSAVMDALKDVNLAVGHLEDAHKDALTRAEAAEAALAELTARAEAVTADADAAKEREEWADSIHFRTYAAGLNEAVAVLGAALSTGRVPGTRRRERERRLHA